jgi:protein kinase-like protein
MDLRPGTRVGFLEILGPLGAGGMGEVHRARDTRLGRDVAVKVLPQSLCHDAKRLARFDREARLLAALNHPAIGAIYGVEEFSGERLLVLELVPGLTLEERIASRPLSLVEALSIGRHVADAVAFAHASSVVHRDLKPANVKCTPDGRVKVLDFGLAKATAEDGTGDEGASTLTAGDTREGTVLGTAAYMSPEQARGQTVDERTDVWSFGCILFEMLSRHRAFRRPTSTETLAAVLTEEPDWTALPEATPAAVRSLLRRCLQRDRDRRVHDMADVRIELDEALASGAQAPAAASAAHSADHRPGWLEIVSAAGLSLLFVGDYVLLARLMPPLAGFREGFNQMLPSMLRAYLQTASWGRWALALLALAWVLAALRGSRFARARRVLMFATTGVVLAYSFVGACLVAEEATRAALAQNLAFKGALVSRDLAALRLAAGEPRLAVDLLDPQHLRDYPKEALVPFGVAGRVFQMAEAYRASGDVEAARRLYERTREAATTFDETTSEQELTQQERWAEEFGFEPDWKLPVGWVRVLPDLLHSVADRRLRELGEQAPAPNPQPAPSPKAR